MGRGRCSGEGRSPAGQGLGDHCLVSGSRPHREQGGDHAPDHPSQEGVGPDIDRDLVPNPPDPNVMHVPDRLRIGPAEDAEVVTALEGPRGSRHRVHVQPVPHPERRAFPERAPRPVPDGVAILPISRRVARVEAPYCPSNVADRDIRRKQPVEGLGQLGRREASRVGEGNHLPRRVDPGVRPAGAVDRLPDPSRESGQRRLERPLDSPGSRLDLIPGEIRAVVFNRRSVSDCPNRLRRALSSAFS